MSEHGKKAPGNKGASRVKTVPEEAPMMPTLEIPAVGADGEGLPADDGAGVDAEDDLALASVLKSPLSGLPLSRQTLFEVMS